MLIKPNWQLCATATLIGLAAGCGDVPLPTMTSAGGSPMSVIADASRDYKRGFYWLPPMVQSPAYSGTFDAALAPNVEICEVVDDQCGTILATYTTESGPGGEVVRLEADDQQYNVNWHTNEFELSTTAQYRVSVRAGINNTLLGYADVQPVANGSGLKNVDTDEFIGLVDGRTLPIKFRIETAIVGNVEVQPVEAEIASGTTQQFVAILSDLHGNAISADVSWAVSDENVATIDQTGLASAVADGETIVTATSERVSGSATLIVVGGVVMVSAGNNAHTCALTPAGKAYCWGLNNRGQLGIGSTINQSTPVAVAGGLTFVQIGTGNTHSCGLTAAGKAYCWGRNDFGQVGDFSFLAQRLEPSPVAGNFTFKTIGVGPETNCGVTMAGQGLCWGANERGNIGLNYPSQNFSPTPIQGVFSAVVPGASHTCGLTTSGETYCWGANTAGQLGRGTITSREALAPVLGGHTFVSISVGGGHTCAVTTSNVGYCWGFNSFGATGTGGGLNVTTPLVVQGGHAFALISAGGGHTCGLTTAGAAYCWGSGSGGRLGLGPVIVNQNAPAAVVGGLIFESIEAGGHTCAITPSHQAYCWGPGASGQLGNGATTTQNTPVPIAALPE